MIFKKDFFLLFASDFTFRYGYQIGKMPLLPYFAMVLGASEILVGTILSISTLTGMFLKPIIGFLSDQLGRKVWLLIASIFFIFFPFMYQFVDTPTELTILRIFHGVATAILGPVTLALVADMSESNSSIKMGVFGMARSAAYLFAPITAGLILNYFSIEIAFYLIGLISIIGSIPILFISSKKSNTKNNIANVTGSLKNLKDQILTAFNVSFYNKAVWRAGILEFFIYFTTYSVKVFIPLQILMSDSGTFIKAGIYLTIQEFFHFLFRPIGGRLGDIWPTELLIRYGLILMIFSLLNLSLSQENNMLYISAVLFGVGQAFVVPASLSLIVKNNNFSHHGSEMGLLGAIRNSGKIMGPVISGFALLFLSYSSLFLIMATAIFFYLVFRSVYRQ